MENKILAPASIKIHDYNNKKCYDCDKVFRTPANLLTHKNRKRPCLIKEIPPERINNPNRCIYCNNVFTNKSHLTAHLKICKIKNGKMDFFIDNKLDQEIRILREKDSERDKLIQELSDKIEGLNNLNYVLKLVNETPKYVYFITEEPFNNKVKIGISKNPLKRLKQLQTGNPDKLVIRHSINSVDYKKLERSLHAICKDLRGVGEWFHMSDSELNNFIGNY